MYLSKLFGSVRFDSNASSIELLLHLVNPFQVLFVYRSLFVENGERVETARRAQIHLPPTIFRFMHDAQVKCTWVEHRARKGGTTYRYIYEGTFITREGALFTIPPVANRSTEHGRFVEHKMLSVLFEENLRQLSPPGARR